MKLIKEEVIDDYANLDLVLLREERGWVPPVNPNF